MKIVANPARVAKTDSLIGKARLSQQEWRLHT